MLLLLLAGWGGAQSRLVGKLYGPFLAPLSVVAARALIVIVNVAVGLLEKPLGSGKEGPRREMPRVGRHGDRSWRRPA
jgi:hypothetical protein